MIVCSISITVLRPAAKTLALMAVTLLRQGKMNPLEAFGGETIEGHDALVKMIQAAHAAEKE